MYLDRCQKYGGKTGHGSYRFVRSLHIFRTVECAGSHASDACNVDDDGNDYHVGSEVEELGKSDEDDQQLSLVLMVERQLS